MLKVLIADDEERICKLIQLLGPWQSLGMEVCATAANGIQALELIQSKHPDLLITDIRMPGCDGLELIARAKAIRPDLEIIIISGYAHFEYARTSIQYGVSDYLLKPINKAELAAALEKCARHCRSRRIDQMEREQLNKSKDDLGKLRANLVRDLLDGRLKEVSAEKLDRTYHFYAKENDMVQAFFLKICSMSEPMSADALGVLQDRVMDIFTASVKDQCNDFLLAFRDDTGYGIMSLESKQRHNLRKALRLSLSRLEAEKTLYGTVRFAIALGTANSVPELPSSFRNADVTMKELLIEGPGKLLEGIPASSELNAQSVLDRYGRNIGHAIDVLSTDAADAALAQLRQSAMAVRNIRGRELIDLVHTAAAIFCSSLAVEDRDGIIQEFNRESSRCCTIDQLFSTLDRLQKKLLTQTLQQRQNEKLRPIRLAKQYIQEHYADPITLEEVAEASGFSGSYFSTIFKKETGKGFNQYVTQIRMEEAKNLLRDTDLQVAEICRRVGYQDLKHFNRLFSKEAGLTPGEYRKFYK